MNRVTSVLAVGRPARWGLHVIEIWFGVTRPAYRQEWMKRGDIVRPYNSAVLYSFEGVSHEGIRLSPFNEGE